MFSKSLRELFRNPIVIVPGALFSILPTLFLAFSDTTFSDVVDPLMFLRFIPFLILGIILLFIFGTFSSCWSYVMCRNAVNGARPSLGETFKEGLRFFPRTLGVSLLTTLIFIGTAVLFMLIAIPVGAILGFMDAVSTSTGGVITALIIGLFILILSVFLGTVISPILPVLVYDNLGIGDSFSRGFKLGMKKFFPILGMILLSIIVVLPIYLILGLLSGSLQALPPVYEFIYTTFAVIPQTFMIIYIMNLYKEMYGEKVGSPFEPTERINLEENKDEI